MTLDEAIKVLEDIQKFVKPGDPPEEHTAIGLGIEALKAIKPHLKNPQLGRNVLLPGETEE